MTGSIGPLVDADEFFNHQIVETHATVLQADLSWTEKVCGMACARDGSLSVNFGFDQPQTLLVQLQGQSFGKVSAALGQVNGVDKISGISFPMGTWSDGSDDVQVKRYTVSGNPDVANAGSALPVPASFATGPA